MQTLLAHVTGLLIPPSSEPPSLMLYSRNETFDTIWVDSIHKSLQMRQWGGSVLLQCHQYLNCRILKQHSLRRCLHMWYLVPMLKLLCSRLEGLGNTSEHEYWEENQDWEASNRAQSIGYSYLLCYCHCAKSGLSFSVHEISMPCLWPCRCDMLRQPILSTKSSDIMCTCKIRLTKCNVIAIVFNSYVNFLSRFQETMLHLRGFRRISLMLSQSATFQISQESFTSSRVKVTLKTDRSHLTAWSKLYQKAMICVYQFLSCGF